MGGELRRQYELNVKVKMNLLDPMEHWLVQWKEGGKKRKAQQAIESLISQVAQQNKGIAKIQSIPGYETDETFQAMVSTAEEKIESLKKQKEKEKKKYEDTYDEPYVSPSLLKRSNSAVEANAKFKENRLQNAEIKKQQNERLATIQEAASKSDALWAEELSQTAVNPIYGDEFANAKVVEVRLADINKEDAFLDVGLGDEIVKGGFDETYLKAARMRGEDPFPEGSGGND